MLGRCLRMITFQRTLRRITRRPGSFQRIRWNPALLVMTGTAEMRRSKTEPRRKAAAELTLMDDSISSMDRAVFATRTRQTNILSISRVIRVDVCLDLAADLSTDEGFLALLALVAGVDR